MKDLNSLDLVKGKLKKSSLVEKGFEQVRPVT